MPEIKICTCGKINITLHPTLRALVDGEQAETHCMTAELVRLLLSNELVRVRLRRAVQELSPINSAFELGGEA